MAKYITTTGSYFDPFTYEELARPVIDAQAEHNAAADAYDALGMETSALERYIGEGEGNAEARKLYDSYQEKLANLQNALWEQGVNANTRRGLAAARNGYASDIARLQKAIQSRQELSKEWSDARKKNPNLVTGANPGEGGLDNFLADDTYGQNWFSYDSAQFEKEVGTEAQARARELLRGLTDASGVIKNPSLKNMLTRVITQGFTNKETMQAGAVVDAILSLSPEDRQAFYEQGQISEPVKILAESLINRYNATGINESDASDADRATLLGRGKAGFSYGVLGKDVKDFSDPDYEMWAAKAAEKDKEENPEGSNKVIPVKAANLSDDDRRKMREKLEEKLGTKLDHPLVTKDGKTISSGLEASALVYMDEARREFFNKTGIDFGRNQNAGKGMRNPADAQIGSITAKDGTTYETRFDPYALGGRGGILIREMGSNIPWKDAELNKQLTEEYHDYRNAYEENLDYYRKNEPDVFKAATLDPDKQYKLYKEHNFNGATSLNDFADNLLASPEYTSAVNIYQPYIAQRGLDDGKYVDKIQRLVSDSLTKKETSSDNEQKFKRNGNFRVGDNNTDFIHKMTKTGEIGSKAVRNPNDVFKMDKDGNITNIKSVRIDADSVLGNYLIISTDNADTDVAVNVDMFGNSAINAAFGATRDKIMKILKNPFVSEADKEIAIHKCTEDGARGILETLGYDINTVSSSGTSSKNQY